MISRSVLVLPVSDSLPNSSSYKITQYNYKQKAIEHQSIYHHIITSVHSVKILLIQQNIIFFPVHKACDLFVQD